MTEEMKKLTEQIEAGVKDVFDSGKYAAYLDTMSKFYRYSVNNVMLIFSQNPDASYVAGYRTWQKEFNRQVRKGEKGLHIIQPVPYKYTAEFDVPQPDGSLKREQRLVAGTTFRAGTVFDISQTDGEPLPEIAKLPAGEVEGFEDYIDAIQSVAGLSVDFRSLSGAQGYYSESEGVIAIREENPELAQLKTGFHELAHSILHNKKTGSEALADRATKEVQAESVAYVVMKHFGFDTSGYSFGYVAAWSGEKDISLLKESLETIQTTADSIITRIEEAMSLKRAEKMEKTLQPAAVMSYT